MPLLHFDDVPGQPLANPPRNRSTARIDRAESSRLGDRREGLLVEEPLAPVRNTDYAGSQLP